MEPEKFPRYEGRGAIIPVALFEAMARYYFGGGERVDSWRTNDMLLGADPYIAVSDCLFCKLCQAYYGEGLTLPQERGARSDESTADTGGDATTNQKTTPAFADLTGPKMVPKGIAAKKLAERDTDDGILTETAEGRSEAGGGSSAAH